jgi:hypothetical protein
MSFFYIFEFKWVYFWNVTEFFPNHNSTSISSNFSYFINRRYYLGLIQIVVVSVKLIGYGSVVNWKSVIVIKAVLT